MKQHMWTLAVAGVIAGCSGSGKASLARDSAVARPTTESSASATPDGGAGGPRTVVVFRSEGPDDGPGFQIAMGSTAVSPVRCDYFGHDGAENLPRLFAAGAYLTLNVRASVAQQLPRTLPVRGSLQAEALACSADDRCENPTSGMIELTSLAVGVGAQGRYQLDLPSGRLEGTFDASWCGPT